MTARLRELAERWKEDYCDDGVHCCADELLSILDAERVVEADDLSQLRAAVADWDDDCDTEVPHHVLMRLTEVGLLEADRFILTKKGQDALAAAPQPGESA